MVTGPHRRESVSGGAAAQAGREDVHGWDRIPRSVFSSWVGQCVLVISGFVLPRMIDHQIGPLALGVWDFAWSIVAYFQLLQLEVGSSINRYVALHQARGDVAGINRVASSVGCILVAMGGAVVLAAAITSYRVIPLFDRQLAGFAEEASWIVLLLGISIAVQVVGVLFGGVLTGLHRWTSHNMVYAGTCGAMLLASVVTLRFGYGLVGLAVVNLCGEAAGRVVRVLLAHRACPGLQIRWRYVDRHTARAMLRFGGKAFVPQLGQLLLSQAVSILIVMQLGPVALARYARPRALVMQVSTFVQKYAMVLVPTTSSLQGAERHQDIQRMAVEATRYGAYFAFPVIVFLALSGGALLDLWMGAAYVDWRLMATLALGYLPAIAFLPLLHILAGLNLHGRPGVANFLATGCAVVLVYVALAHYQGGLSAVALAVAVPSAIANGVYLPQYACRRLGLSLGQFLMKAWRGPLACSAVFGACLLSGHLLFERSSLMALAWGLATGGPVLAWCYWRYVVPVACKIRLKPARLALKPDRVS